ncbi:putative RNA-directed DNA polymerase [Lupinus albus]|uniref:Putative RNA-directed DNA polymerase n=1 Tax=Lupinus albus TaxID=3870 RepID=A0A6A4ND04_LUPAL|nr:putative RNA-directed DNA polymerase [Lupinus albus]
MDTVSDSLLNEESKRKEQSISFHSEANFVERRGRSETHGKNGSRGRRKSRFRGHSQSHMRSIICYYCSKEGHKRSECRSLKRDQKAGNVHEDLVDRRKNGHKPTTAIAVDDDVLLIGEDNYLNVAYGDCSWIVDFGASFHVSPHESFFSNYKKGDYGTVKMGNHVTSKIAGIGDIVLLNRHMRQACTEGSGTCPRYASQPYLNG